MASILNTVVSLSKGDSDLLDAQLVVAKDQHFFSQQHMLLPLPPPKIYKRKPSARQIVSEVAYVSSSTAPDARCAIISGCEKIDCNADIVVKDRWQEEYLLLESPLLDQCYESPLLD